MSSWDDDLDHRLAETPKKLASISYLAKASALAEIWGKGRLIELKSGKMDSLVRWNICWGGHC